MAPQELPRTGALTLRPRAKTRRASLLFACPTVKLGTPNTALVSLMLAGEFQTLSDTTTFQCRTELKLSAYIVSGEGQTARLAKSFTIFLTTWDGMCSMT